MEKQNKLLFGELSYKLNGLLFQTHNELGRFAKEKQYSDFFENKLKENKIFFQKEMAIGDSGNRVDFIVDDKIIVELKAKRFITNEDYDQVQRYLQNTDLDLALLVNFRAKYLGIKRILRRK